jgi:hypothetical protein
MTLGLTFETKGITTNVPIPPSKAKAPAITKRTPNIVTPVGLCLIRSLLLLLILLICVYILHNGLFLMIYNFSPIVPQHGIPREPKVKEPKELPSF